MLVESAENKSAFFINRFYCCFRNYLKCFLGDGKMKSASVCTVHAAYLLCPFQEDYGMLGVRILKKENSKKWQNEKMKIKQAWLFNIYTDGVEGRPWTGSQQIMFWLWWSHRWTQQAWYSVKAKADWESGWRALEQGERPLARGNGQMFTVQCSKLSRALMCILRAKLIPESRLPSWIQDLSLMGRIK